MAIKELESGLSPLTKEAGKMAGFGAKLLRSVWYFLFVVQDLIYSTHVVISKVRSEQVNNHISQHFPTRKHICHVLPAASTSGRSHHQQAEIDALRVHHRDGKVRDPSP